MRTVRLGAVGGLVNSKKGATMDYYAIESYNPTDGKIRRLYVGTAKEALELMHSSYAIAKDTACTPFYRCQLISEEDAQAFADGETYELEDERGEYSITEAAGILNVSRQRVHEMVKAGILQGHKVGNQWSIYRYSVENRLDATR